MSDPSEWTVPDALMIWDPIVPIDPEEWRKLAQWQQWSAATWVASGRPDLANRHEQMADGVLAEVEAVEAGDEEAWVAALALQARTHKDD